ncbi:hypothetical protein Zmor_001192 [Zophobas morio]|uniref:PH domain-containing protein n=1 Tax=Zophobas morio TaxID=2755281 RepID=A0AA38MRD2_9CUCU|nr:hypothetical protein Zmor_001192 [Zophobas morio]
MENLEFAQHKPSTKEPLEGTLFRKHEWQSEYVKAAVRKWNKVYTVLRNSQIFFYPDSKTAHSKPEKTFQGEDPLSLNDATASEDKFYKKKKHVFRLVLKNKMEYLFQAKDEEEMNTWISRINSLEKSCSHFDQVSKNASTTRRCSF